MFNFLSMATNYKERLVENTKINGAEVDTVKVNDSLQGFETAVMHPSYHDNQWVIVEMYDTKKEAKIGHAKWVEMFKDELPKELTDVSTAKIALLENSLSGKSKVYRKDE